ncbi:MAG: roadblock/LC7 domain-containing protein [Methanomassiliicoccales archaeon]|jgi:predicted regulator of Ras-like GTPase activity (Roadblock/LC7/MglB family)
MAEIAQARNVLEEIKRLEHVQDVSLVSRGGMYVLGDPPRGVHQETYAAMSGIIIGAAETTAAEMKDNLRHVHVRLIEKDLLLVAASNRYILAITTDGRSEVENMVRAIQQLLSKTDMQL